MAKHKSHPGTHGNQRIRSQQIRNKRARAVSESIASANARLVELEMTLADSAAALGAIIEAWEVTRNPENPARDLLNPFAEAKRVRAVALAVLNG